MNLQEYTPYWDVAEPLMRLKLESLKQLLQPLTNLTLSELSISGDEEKRVSLDLTSCGVVVLGVDLVLADADVSGLPGDGVGVKLEIVGYGGLVENTFAPFNYTDFAFSKSMEDLVDRIQLMDCAAMSSYILNKALANPALLAELQGIGITID